MTRTIRLAVIGGDGIGPEVVAEALKVLRGAIGADATLETTDFALGAARYLETGDVLPDAELEAIAGHDAILLGAVGGAPGDPRLAGANIERGLLLKLRFSLDHYVNLRPTRLYPGYPSPLKAPGDVDFVVVREGTEGPYVGNGGRLREGTPAEVATEVSVNTAYGVERVVRFAFAKAAERRGRLTLVHKTNVLTFSGSLWRRIVDAVATEFPGRRRRLPARRRGHDLPRDGSVALRRDRHGQPVRRHPHRPRRRRSAAASASRPRPT